MRKWGTFFLAVVATMAVTMVTYGGSFNQYSSDLCYPEDPVPHDETDRNSGFDWLQTGDYDFGIPTVVVLQPDEYLTIGMDNWWFEDKFKTLYLEFDVAPGACPCEPAIEIVGLEWGYHPLTYSGPSGSRVLYENITDNEDSLHYSWSAEIYPQPDWEKLTLHNVSHSGMELSSIVFSSECIVPEPITITLLGMGCLALAASRRRSTN